MNDILNNYAQAIANNDLKAIVAVTALALHPGSSYSLSLTGSLSSSGITVGKTESATYNSADSIAVARDSANYQLKLQAYDKIGGVSVQEPAGDKDMKIQLRYMRTVNPNLNMASMLLVGAGNRAEDAAQNRWNEMQGVQWHLQILQ